jgi:hypothetical protein
MGPMMYCTYELGVKVTMRIHIASFAIGFRFS